MLAEYHDDDHLVKFEELLEAAVDLDKIPDEYLICASYDAGLQVHSPHHLKHLFSVHAPKCSLTSCIKPHHADWTRYLIVKIDKIPHLCLL